MSPELVGPQDCHISKRRIFWFASIPVNSDTAILERTKVTGEVTARIPVPRHRIFRELDKRMRRR